MSFDAWFLLESTPSIFFVKLWWNWSHTRHTMHTRHTRHTCEERQGRAFEIEIEIEILPSICRTDRFFGCGTAYPPPRAGKVHGFRLSQVARTVFLSCLCHFLSNLKSGSLFVLFVLRFPFHSFHFTFHLTFDVNHHALRKEHRWIA